MFNFINSIKHTPYPRGPYATGCMDFMHGKTKEGTLMRLFYPCEEKNYRDVPEKWTRWFPGEAYTDGIALFTVTKLRWLFSFLFNWETRECLVPALWEVPVAKGKFPVLVFSHGLAAHRTFYSSICTDIVSHGFIVAAVEHRDESSCATFTLSSNKEKEWMLYRTVSLDASAFPLRQKQVHTRARECSSALNLLERLNKEEIANELSSNMDLSTFRSKLDLTSPGIIGHSMGAATSLIALTLDKRFKYCVGYDPWMFPIKDDIELIKSSISQPTFIIMTEKFLSEKNNKAFEKAQNESIHSVIMKGTAHQNQSDTPFVLGMFASLSVMGSTMDPETALTLNNKITIAFICKCLGLPNITSKIGSSFAKENLLFSPNSTEISLEKLKDLTGIQIVYDEPPAQKSRL